MLTSLSIFGGIIFYAYGNMYSMELAVGHTAINTLSSKLGTLFAVDLFEVQFRKVSVTILHDPHFQQNILVFDRLFAVPPSRQGDNPIIQLVVHALLDNEFAPLVVFRNAPQVFGAHLAGHFILLGLVPFRIDQGVAMQFQQVGASFGQ